MNSRLIFLKHTILFFFLLLFVPVSTLYSQEKKLQPEWWFGGAAGANLNYYSSASILMPSSSSPFTKGAGTGLFLSPLAEYTPDPVWGGMLFFGFDSRRGSFDDAGNQSLTTTMNYLSLEPSLRITPFQSNLYFFVGPRIGINVAKSFTYSQSGQPDVSGDLSNARGTMFGGQVGLGYDFSVGSPASDWQTRISPFIAVHFPAEPISNSDWKITTVRLGAAVKFGSTTGVTEKAENEIQFSVRAPKLIPVERKVNETFPMRNYVFFDAGSNAVPSRYVMLNSTQAKDFKEEQLIQPEPKDLSGRSRRQLKVYHQILNVFGDRMRRYPQTRITLSGSSENGAAEGKALAEEVKKYLTVVFGIESSRIITEGNDKPEIPSFLPGGTRELELVKPEDRRVEISSSSPELLEPVKIVSLQEDPLDSDVLFTASGADQVLASWSVEVTDDAGKVQRFGPFTSDQERISGKTILGSSTRSSYRVAMVGETKGGQSIRKESTMRLVRSEEPEANPAIRFSILFEFDQSKTVSTYERFLTTVVAPLIPDGGNVTIHGHTDIVGEESHNLKLSRDRAVETREILQQAVSKKGKRRVTFDAYGFGEEVRRAPFDNALPEERFYNRTVVIDIVPE